MIEVFNKGSLFQNKGALLGNKDGLLEDKEPLLRRVFLLGLQIVFAEIFAVGREVVVDEVGEDFLQLEEESLAWFVAVGEHVELC